MKRAPHGHGMQSKYGMKKQKLKSKNHSIQMGNGECRGRGREVSAAKVERDVGHVPQNEVRGVGVLTFSIDVGQVPQSEVRGVGVPTFSIGFLAS